MTAPATNGMTDQRLATLLAEHDALGERVREIDARLAVDERALEEVAGAASGNGGEPSTLAEISGRRDLVAQARDLSAEQVRRTRGERTSALGRRREIVLEIADGLPADEWVAAGEWALRTSREHRSGPRVLRRALAEAVGRRGAGSRPTEVLALSARLERSRRRRTEVVRFLASPGRVARGLLLACLAPGVVALVAAGAVFGRPGGSVHTASLVVVEAAQGVLLLFGMFLCLISPLLLLSIMLAVLPGSLPGGAAGPSVQEPGTIGLSGLTAAYRLPERGPGAGPTSVGATGRGSAKHQQMVLQFFVFPSARRGIRGDRRRAR